MPIGHPPITLLYVGPSSLQTTSSFYLMNYSTIADVNYLLEILIECLVRERSDRPRQTVL